MLGGAELVRALVVFQEYRSKVPRMHALLRLLHVFWERQQHGKTLRSREVRKVMRQSGISQWDEFRNLLLDARLIQRTDEGGYILSRDLRNLTLAQLLAALPWPLHTQLRIRSQQEMLPWEDRLKDHMDEARGELMQTLKVPLDELFRGQVDSQPQEETNAD